ncbi:hypothetical protein [Brevundimonas aveniformis]|uniref:hypothetical protein n=1 Tax=Brevundimonas aveniformis TaxID=370977 RepID=UPI00248FDEC3|nr:hypothetical protein [Brevundimonas aveniformis]
MRTAVFVAALAVLLVACGGGDDSTGGDASGAVLPLGVYECDAPMMMGGMVVPNPQTGPMFGVTAPGRYRDFDGGIGRFELADHVLTMTSGPLEGTRYRQDPEMETYFQLLDDAGEVGEIRCVLNADKDIDAPW